MDGRSINKNKTCTIIIICKYTCVDTDRKEFAKKMQAGLLGWWESGQLLFS